MEQKCAVADSAAALFAQLMTSVANPGRGLGELCGRCLALMLRFRSTVGGEVIGGKGAVAEEAGPNACPLERGLQAPGVDMGYMNSASCTASTGSWSAASSSGRTRRSTVRTTSVGSHGIPSVSRSRRASTDLPTGAHRRRGRGCGHPPRHCAKQPPAAACCRAGSSERRSCSGASRHAARSGKPARPTATRTCATTSARSSPASSPDDSGHAWHTVRGEGRRDLGARICLVGSRNVSEIRMQPVGRSSRSCPSCTGTCRSGWCR
jgi:hypothetical protein